MMNKNNYYYVGTYEINNALVDIMVEGDCYAAYIYRKDFGIKTHMFSIKIDTTTLDDFIQMVEVDSDDSLHIWDKIAGDVYD